MVMNRQCYRAAGLGYRAAGLGYRAAGLGYRAAGLALPAWGVMAVLGAGLGGCDVAKMMAFHSTPTSEKVQAEYAHLPGKRVLVLVWVPPEVKWDYPHVRLDLSAHLAAYLRQNVEDVSVVDPVRVEAYLEKSNQLDASPEDVGEHFRADRVIYLAVYQFSIRDPGMAHFYRGRLAASVEVRDLRTEDPTAQRIPLREVEVAYPEKDAAGLVGVRPVEIRKATYELFTVEVGKKFHKHERPVE